ncbi:MAG: hypothetical protein ACLQA5_21445 [Solirubrobacteraceae bacterium]
MTSLTYHDAAGATHTITVHRTAAGNWEVLDTGADEMRVIDTLDGRVDTEAQAEAVARDYVTVGRLAGAPGRAPGEAIPEQGGADAHSHRRSRLAARQCRVRGTALPHPAG